MDYSVDTPFRTYQDIQEAVRTKKVLLSYDRNTAFNIACSVNPLLSILNLIIPLISMLLIYLACNFLSTTKWVLLFGLVALLLNAAVPHIKGFLWILAIALIALPLFFFNNVMWLVPIGFGIIGMIFGYYAWWEIISGMTSKAVMADELLFESLWKGKKLALRADNTMDGFYNYGKAEYNKIVDKMKK